MISVWVDITTITTWLGAILYCDRSNLVHLITYALRPILPASEGILITHCKFDLAMQLPGSECVRQFDKQEVLEGTPQALSSTLIDMGMPPSYVTLASLQPPQSEAFTFRSIQSLTPLASFPNY